jgi:hypothetical protein
MVSRVLRNTCTRTRACTRTHLREVLLDHGADVLRVVEVKRGVHLVQDVDGRGLEPVTYTLCRVVSCCVVLCCVVSCRGPPPSGQAHATRSSRPRHGCTAVRRRPLLAAGAVAHAPTPTPPRPHLHSASTRLSASRLRWPPLSSVRLSFHTPPNATRTCAWHAHAHGMHAHEHARRTPYAHTSRLVVLLLPHNNCTIPMTLATPHTCTRTCTRACACARVHALPTHSAPRGRQGRCHPLAG